MVTNSQLGAGGRVIIVGHVSGPGNRADSQVEASQGMPELRDCHCSKDGFNGLSRGHVLGRRSVLTEIPLDYHGIVEIDHAGGQLME